MRVIAAIVWTLLARLAQGGRHIAPPGAKLHAKQGNRHAAFDPAARNSRRSRPQLQARPDETRRMPKRYPRWAWPYRRPLTTKPTDSAPP